MILYLQIAPITIGMRGIIINVTTTLNVLKKPFLAAWLNISQVFIIFIPVAFILSNYTEFGLRGIFASSVISSLIVSILSYFILNKELKRLENV
jgi:Na+-driven multidrug efflux pump